MQEKIRTAVIGGGAAGFFAAIHAGEKSEEVFLFEKSNKILAKVKVSGGGRCNVTNGCTEISELVKNYPRGHKELRGPFSRFSTSDTWNWFTNRGVELKTEDDGRVFPQSDSSQTIINCLVEAAENAGVKIKMQTAIVNLIKIENSFQLTFNDGNVSSFDKVIIATGGNPSPEGYNWLKELGHTIIAPVPSLFTFNIPDNPFADLMGIAVKESQVKIEGLKMEQSGPLLFTHWGVSGPAILKLSAHAARMLNEKNYDFYILVNFCNGDNEYKVKDELLKFSSLWANKIVINTPFRNLSSRLWERLCNNSGIDNYQRWNETGKSAINKLLNNIIATRLHVIGKTTFKEEFVTCGGVSLKNINMQTMESKILPGLFFAGEVLDIDGVTGGFNFQAAWTTGFLAGRG